MLRAKIRKQIIICFLLITPLGVFFKFYQGPGGWWFNEYGAGLLYEIFWILVIFSFLPNKDLINRIPLGVFIATSALEVLQLSHFWILEEIRSTFLGRALIGTTFVWWDFPHYAIGCIIGWLWIRSVVRRSGG